jgi:cell wall-associated NlpC family hydrolase
MIDIDKFINDLLSLAARNVPWLHQGRDPKVGVDCIGLLRFGYLQQHKALPEELEREFDAYLRRPDGEYLLSVMAIWFEQGERTDRRRGDMLVIYDRKNPQHIAVMINNNEVVEAYCSPRANVRKVLRQRLDPRRVVAAVFRFPVEGEKLSKWQA